MKITAEEALTRLLRTPREFLNYYPIRIWGSRLRGSSEYVIKDSEQASRRPGAILGTLRTHETQLFTMKPINTSPDGYSFNAHSIKMFQMNRPDKVEVYNLNGTGPEIMVTGQLSGCSFAISINRSNNSLDVVHIQPDANGGVILQSTLERISSWDIVYGRRNYSEQEAVSIVGVRIGVDWQIYAQKQNRQSEDYRVKQVSRLI